MTHKEEQTIIKKPLPNTFSSPTSAVSSEETRILTEYMNQSSLFNISKHDESRRKPLVLKMFFKMKRNQQVVVMLKNEEEDPIEAKVTAIGRDFVMLTNLQNRIWIPYTAIDSANIPYGTPTYSNSHQHFLYDNDLKNKLVTQFGKTVARKDTLIQQFFEETLRTNLHSWSGTWVKVRVNDTYHIGKIIETKKDLLHIRSFYDHHYIKFTEIHYVSTIRMFQLARKITDMFRKMYK